MARAPRRRAAGWGLCLLHALLGLSHVPSPPQSLAPSARRPLARQLLARSTPVPCRLCARRAEEKRIAEDGLAYTKKEFLQWYPGSGLREWRKAGRIVPEPPPVPVSKKAEISKSKKFGSLRFTVNASVGHFVRPVYIKENGLLLCIGDWTGDVTGLDAETGRAKFTAKDSGLRSIHSCTHVPEAGVMVCGGAWTGNVSAFDTATGESRWCIDAGVGEYARSVLAEEDNLVVVAGGGTKPNVAAVDPETGEVRYDMNPEIGAIWTLTYMPSTGKILCGASWTRPEKIGRVACLEPSSGELLYNVDPGVGRYVCSACPEGTDLVLCGGELGLVAALKAADGAVQYKVNASVGDVWDLEDTPDGVLCVGGWTGMVSNIDAQTGDVRFVVNSTIDKIYSSRYVPELGVLLLGNNNGTIAGLDPATGEIKFKMDAGIHDPGKWDPVKSNPWNNELWRLDYVPEANLVFCGGDTNFTVRALAT